jgi:hypothetical protein
VPAAAWSAIAIPLFVDVALAVLRPVEDVLAQRYVGRASVVLALGDAKPPQVSANDRDCGCAERDGAERGHEPAVSAVDSPTITSSAVRSRHVAHLEQ